jgi:excisionase family DNA binding protein
MQPKYTAEEAEAISRLNTLTVKQAAHLAGVSVGCLYRRWREGGGPESFKVGKCRRIRRKALDAWLAGLAKAAK